MRDPGNEVATHLEDQVTEFSGGIRRVTEGEADCVTAGGRINNALSRLNIFGNGMMKRS